LPFTLQPPRERLLVNPLFPSTSTGKIRDCRVCRGHGSVGALGVKTNHNKRRLITAIADPVVMRQPPKSVFVVLVLLRI
jgi:hypothetical protein